MHPQTQVNPLVTPDGRLAEGADDNGGPRPALAQYVGPPPALQNATGDNSQPQAVPYQYPTSDYAYSYPTRRNYPRYF